MSNLIQTILIAAIPAIHAITLRGAAHAYAAKRLGDQTAFEAGRLSMNPFKHIDLFGTLLLPAITLISSLSATSIPILFGWAKPVPVDYDNFSNPKQDMFWLALSGTLANFAMAIIWACLIKLTSSIYPLEILSQNLAGLFIQMFAWGIKINLILMVFNLLPIPPMDGGLIVMSLLPMKWALLFSRIERYGFLIILILIFSGLFRYILWPVVNSLSRFIALLLYL